MASRSNRARKRRTRKMIERQAQRNVVTRAAMAFTRALLDPLPEPTRRKERPRTKWQDTGVYRDGTSIDHAERRRARKQREERQAKPRAPREVLRDLPEPPKHCKERPTPGKGSGGRSRAFVPWCERKR